DGLCRSPEPAPAGRDGARLRHQPDQQGIHARQPEREEHVRVRRVVQHLTGTAMSTSTRTIEELASRDYRYGFVTDVEQEALPRGLISAKKDEPEWLLEWRLKAYRIWQTMHEPTWGNIKYGPIDYQDIIYYAAPKAKPVVGSLDEVDPEIRRTFEKLGIPLEEQKLL